MNKDRSATRRHRGRAGKRAFALALSLAISALGAEIFLRTTRHKPWNPGTLDISVEPDGKLFRVDETVGYTQLPGYFRFKHGTGYEWTATHGRDTLRVTAPEGAAVTNDSRPEIWLFGCSYTYGWSVNDDETYPWLLQERFPEKKIVNFGVGGYGTINSFLQFRQALETRTKPALTVVSYASFHDARNLLLRKMAKTVVPYSEAFGSRWRPYARIDDDGSLRIDFSELEYREFPLMRHSAAVHLFEQAYNNFEQSYYDGHEVSRILLESFSALAQENGIRFIVAGIDEESLEMLDTLRKRGIETVDISVDLSKKGSRNLPHDGHPSFETHRAYAQKLSKLLESSPVESH